MKKTMEETEEYVAVRVRIRRFDTEQQVEVLDTMTKLNGRFLLKDLETPNDVLQRQHAALREWGYMEGKE